MNREVLDMCIKNIKVVHEDPKTAGIKILSEPTVSCRTQNSFYYLGFGYGRVNVERLKISAARAAGTKR
jgi:hypothetical protein